MGHHGPRNALPLDYDCMAVAEMLGTLRDRITAVRGNSPGSPLKTPPQFGILKLEKAIPLIYFAEMARKFLRDRRSAPLWVIHPLDHPVLQDEISPGNGLQRAEGGGVEDVSA